MADFEIAIVGAGVVGLAVAARLSERHRGILLLEKNDKYGMETSSRNSEVIHAGIYYQPGSLKAKLCVEGRELLYEICEKYNVAHRHMTKLIIATNDAETEKLETIQRNARENGIRLPLLSKAETLALEPNINAVAALFSERTGIVSAHELMEYYFRTTLNNGGTVQQRTRVVGIERAPSGYDVTIDDQGQQVTFTSDIVINATGLYSDKVAAMAGIDIDAAGYRLTYAKGSYFTVAPSKAKLVSRLVYPVPQNEGIGVHAVLDWGGRLKFGPDVEYLADDRFEYSVAEEKRHAFGDSIRKILPQISDEDITPDMSGIRPKLQRKGEPPRDFVICHERDRHLEGFINLVGIESPGLTSSPAIARYVEQLLFA